MSSGPESIRRVVTVVYASLFASVGVYAVLLRILPVTRTGAAPRPAVEWGLLATGIAEYLLTTLLGRRMLVSRGALALNRVRSFFLIRFAAAEAIALFGLIVYFLGAPSAHAFLFFAVSAVAFLSAYPAREQFGQDGAP